jgi:hypothetical protein
MAQILPRSKPGTNPKHKRRANGAPFDFSLIQNDKAPRQSCGSGWIDVS